MSFFGFVGSAVDPNRNAIFNLGLNDPNIKGEDFVGGLIGQLENGTIMECFVEGGSVVGVYK